MLVRVALLVLLVAAIVVVSSVFARPLLGLPEPTARPSPAAATPRPSAVVIPSPSGTLVAVQSPTPTPPRTPTTTCPPVPAGGKEGGFHSLIDVRIAHQPGFDRVVLDFGPEASAQDELPAFRIERASSFTAISGQPVPVQGSALWSVRADGASMADRSGNLAYKGPRDLDPTTTLVRDVKIVEDFEAVMIWGIGLARLECPRVSTLRSPLRLVLDFPEAP
jgi:hypothetical protein